MPDGPEGPGRRTRGRAGERRRSRPGRPHDAAAARIDALLHKLQAPLEGDAEGRTVGGAGVPALEALLDLIDETVMARRLRLTNAAGAELALEVCNRRLLRVEREGAASPGGLSADTLTYAGAEDLAALRDGLAAFCAAGDVRARALRASGSATLEQTGIAVATLRQAWAAEAPSPTEADAQRGAAPGEEGPGRTPAQPSLEIRIAEAFPAIAAGAISAAADLAAPPGGGPRRLRAGETEGAARLADLLRDDMQVLGLGPAEACSALLLAGDNGAPALLLLAGPDGRAAFLLHDTAATEALYWAAHPGRADPRPARDVARRPGPDPGARPRGAGEG